MAIMVISHKHLFYNNIFWNNIATDTSKQHLGEDLYINSGPEDNTDGLAVTLKNNDLGINSNFITGISEDLFISNTQNYQHNNNITVDPFLDSAGHLSGSVSALIDTGICGYYHMTPFGFEYIRVAPYDDFEGDARPGDGTVLGCDIGADEYFAKHHFYWPMFFPGIIPH